MRFAPIGVAAAIAALLPVQALADDNAGNTSRGHDKVDHDTSTAYWAGDYEWLELAPGQRPSDMSPDDAREALRAQFDANLKELRALSFAATRCHLEDTCDHVAELMFDHTENNEEVIELADELGVHLGPGPEEVGVRLAINQLSPFQWEGLAFDSHLIDHELSMHDAAIVEVERMRDAVAAESEDVGDLLDDTSEVLHDHQDDALDLADDVGLDGDELTLVYG